MANFNTKYFGTIFDLNTATIDTLIGAYATSLDMIEWRDKVDFYIKKGLIRDKIRDEDFVDIYNYLEKEL